MSVNPFQTLCPGCFQAKGKAAVCAQCGYDEKQKRSPLVLPHRTLLHHGQFLIGRVLGKPGGFGITYLGYDTRLQTRVAIKEYLPRDQAGRDTDHLTVTAHSQEEQEFFNYGLTQFLNEARTLAQFDHPAVVRVRSFFEENATGYLVMDYYEGLSLAEHLQQLGGRLPEKLAIGIMMPILDGLREVHAKGFLHRDIKPANIYLTTDKRPILLDFGAARFAMSERSRSLSVVLTEGYAPYEQYHRRGEQGAWTDIYACAAVLYHMVTGQVPPPATDRKEHDELQDPRAFGASNRFADAVVRGLAMAPAQRPATAREFQTLLLGENNAESPLPDASDVRQAEDITSLLLKPIVDKEVERVGQWVAELKAVPEEEFIEEVEAELIKKERENAKPDARRSKGQKTSARGVQNATVLAEFVLARLRPYALTFLAAGAVCFIFSWFLPVHERIDAGWKAFWSTAGMIFDPSAYSDVVKRGGYSLIAMLSPHTNFVALGTLILAFREKSRPWLRVVTMGLVASLFINLYWWYTVDLNYLRIGYFLWLLSFLLLAAGTHLRALADSTGTAAKGRALDGRRVSLGWKLVLLFGLVTTAPILWEKLTSPQETAKATSTANFEAGVRAYDAREYVTALNYFKPLAEQGHAGGQAYLGRMYLKGQGGLQQDYEKAVDLFGKAAGQGNAWGQNGLGVMYKGGLGVAQDDVKAVELFRKAAEQGHALGQVNLGLMHEFGRGGLPQDPVKAVELYRDAVEQRNASGQVALGVMYENGQGGLPQDPVKAVELYRQATEQGDALGQVNLGVMYESGRGGLPKDPVKAVELYRQAADQGNDQGQKNLGLMYHYGEGGLPQDPVKAVELYRKAAEQGNAGAQNNLGIMYENGKGIEPDANIAMEWYRKAAEQGETHARENLERLKNSLQNAASTAEDNYRAGVKALEAQDYATALSYFQPLADAGKADAQAAMGWMYVEGKGVEKNYAAGRNWYLKSIAQGNTTAQNNLGAMYENGEGVEPDLNTAMDWYRKAAEQGHVKARENVERLKNRIENTTPASEDRGG